MKLNVSDLLRFVSWSRIFASSLSSVRRLWLVSRAVCLFICLRRVFFFFSITCVFGYSIVFICFCFFSEGGYIFSMFVWLFIFVCVFYKYGMFFYNYSNV